MSDPAEEIIVLDAASADDQSGAGTSRQDDQPDDWTPGGSIEPPEDLYQLMRLTAINGTRRGIIEAVSLNTVGLGHTIALREGHEQAVDEPQEAAIVQLLDSLAERDWRLDNPGFGELLQAVKHDEEGCGNGYVEISRNKLTGMIDGFYHLPGHLVRRRKDRRGWVMGRRSQLASERDLFYNYGDKVQYDDDGKATGKLRPGRNWSTNEILRFRIYSSESRDYGLPRDVALAADYAGDNMAAEANLSFFDNAGTPPSVLFVQGTENEQGGRVTFKVPQKTVDRIAATMRSNPGSAGNRVAIVPVPAGTQTDLVQLGQLSERDMSFTEYRGDNRNRQLSAFRVAPVFVSVNSEGRYSAEVERAITLEQVFDPEQRRYERRINRLLRDLGYAPYELHFKRLAVEGDAAVRENAEMLAESGNITVGEHRKAHGYPPYREADEGADPKEELGEKPFGFNNKLLAELMEDEETAIEPPPASEHTPASEDQRGERPGVGSRSRKRPPADDQASVADKGSRKAIGKRGGPLGARIAKRREAIAKAGDGHDDDLPEYVEWEISELAGDLKVGSIGGDDGDP